MLATQLVSEVLDLIAKHGDLEVYFDCDSVIVETSTITLLDEPYLDRPVFVIFPSS